MSSAGRTLTQELVAEHESIHGMLDVLAAMCQRISEGSVPPAEDLEQVLEFLAVIVEALHHGKEEQLLFPALDAQGPVDQGGPRCTLFMDYWLNWNPVHPIREQADSSGVQPPEVRPAIQAILDKKNSLSIPIREHIAGHMAAEMMKRCVTEYRASGTLPTERFLAAAREYTNLLHLHIRKENECLFIMAESRLPESLLIELAERSAAIEAEVTTERIARCMQDLSTLKKLYLKT